MTNPADKISRSKMDIYAIYLRKSRQDDEAESIEETLQRHKNILTDLAARKGLYVGEIYQEVVSGAESVDSRPEIKRLIQDAKDSGRTIDVTCGRRTRAVIITDSEHVILSAIQSETIANRLYDDSLDDTDEEETEDA